MFRIAEFSRENSGNVESDEEEGNGKSFKESQRSREKGSKMLPRRKLGMIDIGKIDGFCLDAKKVDLSVWLNETEQMVFL